MINVNIHSNEKSSTIRLKQKTKDMLEQLTKGKETHNDIILRLIKMANTLKNESKTQIVHRGNIIGTKYEKIHKTIQVKLNEQTYDIVCTYNDLSLIALMQNKSLRQLSDNQQLDWRLELEIVNIKKGTSWIEPKKIHSKELHLMYFICVKNILEDNFDIKLFQFSNLQDYFNIDNWFEAYNTHNLSKESLQFDIRKKIQ